MILSGADLVPGATGQRCLCVCVHVGEFSSSLCCTEVSRRVSSLQGSNQAQQPCLRQNAFMCCYCALQKWFLEEVPEHNTNKVPEHNTNKVPEHNINKVPEHNTNKVPEHNTNKVPEHNINKVPEHNTNKEIPEHNIKTKY
uniref:Uncharacterized protein n=1 Tax=Mastacembelus armatus TaxID=205130 RepID=A0A3Q3NAD4_9TELE